MLLRTSGDIVAARFALHPLPEGLAVGGGLSAGVTVKLGPGRMFATLTGEAFAAPAAYSPWVLGPTLGYEFDLPGLMAE